MQEGSVGVRHHLLLRAADVVALLLVRDGPALLGLTQLLQAVVKPLNGGERKWVLIDRGDTFGFWAVKRDSP